jgi:probable F420-dependent oxidoreductase
MKLGKLGVWTAFDELSATAGADLARRIEQWGYSALWLPEAFGRDVVAQSAWLLANTNSLIVAPGIANIYGRDPMMMRAGQMGLSEQSGGRFLLGVGVSHPMVVTKVRGHEFGKPIETMRNYLAAMNKAPYYAPAPAEAPKIILAALGPKMLELSRDAADGAHPYNSSPKHTAMARKIIGPGKWLCVEQKVVLETNPDRARDVARKVLGFYMTASNYQNNWLRMGFNADDFANGGSDRLIDDIVAWGDEGAIIRRIEQHWEAGADHVCIQTSRPDRPVGKLGFAEIDEKLLSSLARLNR